MGSTLDSRFLSLVVHDLRTPLNVIGLSLSMIEQSIPGDDPSLEEDLRIVRENTYQIERMLASLSDFNRLTQGAGRPSSTPFEPRRLLSEVVEALGSRPPAGQPPIRLELRPGCPPEVELDPILARQALLYALGNAQAAADGTPVEVVAGGSPGRWITEIRTSATPPPSLRPSPLSSDRYERLQGSAAERLGLDLAITARVTELLGGSARLDVTEGRGTAIVLDWPVKLRPIAAESHDS